MTLRMDISMNKRKQQGGKTIPQPLETLEWGLPVARFNVSRTGTHGYGNISEFGLMLLWITVVFIIGGSVIWGEVVSQAVLLAGCVTAPLWLYLASTFTSPLLGVFSPKTVHIIIFEPGFSIAAYPLRLFRWDEIEAFFVMPLVREGTDSRGPSHLLDGYAIRIEAAHQPPFEIKLGSGAQVVIERLQDELTAARYGETMMRLESGETLEFGDIAISKHGMRDTARHLSWAAVYRVELRQFGQEFYVVPHHPTGDDPGGIKATSDRVSHVRLLMKLAAHYTSTATSDPGNLP